MPDLDSEHDSELPVETADAEKHIKRDHGHDHDDGQARVR